MNFGDKLKKILKEKDMSQSDLAKMLNIKHPVISRWIKGRSNNPKMETIEKLAEGLNIPVNYFLESGSVPPANPLNSTQETRNQNADNIGLITRLIDEQNKKFEEKNRRFELEISLLKKDNELLKKEIKVLSETVKNSKNSIMENENIG